MATIIRRLQDDGNTKERWFFKLNCDMRTIRNLRHLLFGKKIIMTVSMYSLEK